MGVPNGSHLTYKLANTTPDRGPDKPRRIPALLQDDHKSPHPADVRVTPCLTPHGRLVLVRADDAGELDPAVADRVIPAFARGAGHGLLQLGAEEVGRVLPAPFAFFRDFGARFVAAVCASTDATEHSAIPLPPDDDLDALVASTPPMPGAEYCTRDVLADLWRLLGAAFETELAASRATIADFLKRRNPAWNVVGRVHFHLAENRRDEEAPFAFLATYTTRLSADGKAQHLPLGQALREYADSTDKQRLLSLLLPVQRAAQQCAWLKEMVDAGDIFHPLRWSPREAYRLLSDAPDLERAGVVVRMPPAWKGSRPARPQVTATVGRTPPKGRFGGDALLDFRVELSLNGERLTRAEAKALLDGVDGLALLRGQWVEVDRERLARTMEQLERAERLAAQEGLSFAQAMRLLAGTSIGKGDAFDAGARDWAHVVPGPWLAEVLKGLRSPESLAHAEVGSELRGTLRPYQQVGARWLHLLSELGLGACLADDMGLGKTIQVLALLLLQRRNGAVQRPPSLLVAPASLLANWASEIERFAPELRALVVHPSALSAQEHAALGPEKVAMLDLVITSYGSLLRQSWLADAPWNLVILDEAQAIKNPSTKQTRTTKKLRAHARVALTGTPIENHLGDLWSIFDFLNPGLLGSAKDFASYTKRLASDANRSYGPLRDLIKPYILRRLKTDRSIIADLPDKTDVKAYCQLSRKQAALYQQAVDDLREQLEQAEGMQRRGVVLASLLRFKQICNHPSQWLGDGGWAEDDSGKWARLREVAETVAAKQEKALVFTQFRQLTEPLAAFLGGIFGRPGMVLSGSTDVKKRKELVKRFQEDERVPFFVLSLKAGGSGLNLTAASHVVHFDRWWNPSVENQATDRAFRIGQKKNVLAHKFVCRGTIEEKIDELIESKKHLSQELLEGGSEIHLTELKDDELLELVSLDWNRALKE